MQQTYLIYWLHILSILEEYLLRILPLYQIKRNVDPTTGGLSDNILFEGVLCGKLVQQGRSKTQMETMSPLRKLHFMTPMKIILKKLEEDIRTFLSFLISHVYLEDYLRNNNAIELDMFDVTGGAENAQNSSQSQFYEIYSNSDFMRQFELINRRPQRIYKWKSVISSMC